MSGNSNSRAIVPAARPRITATEALARLAPFKSRFDGRPILIAGFRDYYLDSIGKPGVGDRGTYDDAIVAFIDGRFHTFNGNTDPSSYRAGSGVGAGKGMAVLKEGFYDVHRLDTHRRGTKGAHLALCQRGGPVTVLRDGVKGSYADTGNHGINIHKGGFGTTSSLGCQTIYPPQWGEFISLVETAARKHFGAAWNRTNIPYALVKWS